MAKTNGYAISNIMKLPIDDSESMPALGEQECILWKNAGKLYLCVSDDGIDKYAIQLGKV